MEVKGSFPRVAPCYEMFMDSLQGLHGFRIAMAKLTHIQNTFIVGDWKLSIKGSASVQIETFIQPPRMTE